MAPRVPTRTQQYNVGSEPRQLVRTPKAMLESARLKNREGDQDG